jgi:predicted dehydrogenase
VISDKYMKIVIIGGAGHYDYIIPAIIKYGYEIVGICTLSGSVKDDLAGLSSSLDMRGLSYKIFSDYNTMLDETAPDIAVVNTVFCENGRIAADVIKRGIHVFCEKPLATDFDMLDRLESAYRSVNKSGHVCLAGMFGLRYNSVMVTVKQAVKTGLVEIFAS